MTDWPPKTRHVNSINDLSNEEIESVFELADSFLRQSGDPHFPHRIARSHNVAPNSILASLFFEPSTRTRLSFESAMLRLGGQFITSADPATSSSAKGETLADTVRVVSNYADIIVIRHPRDGAARLAAEFSTIPVINGGDGSHEHPTQTLCDLFTLHREGRPLSEVSIAISGDLKGSRTVHSFVYALARFGAGITPMPAPGMELPAHVERRLREEFDWEAAKPAAETEALDALYQTPDEPHQPALFPNLAAEGDAAKKFNAVYITRFQKERWADAAGSYPRIDADFLKESKYDRAKILHPLPRVGELDAKLDSDKRAVYFQQASYGVPVRMALISFLLGVDAEHAFPRYEGGFSHDPAIMIRPRNADEIRCQNANCIVHDEMERQHLHDKFFLIGHDRGHPMLRCLYCDSDIENFVAASRKSRWYSADPAIAAEHADKINELAFFATEEDAGRAGYHPKRGSGKKAADRASA